MAEVSHLYGSLFGGSRSIHLAGDSLASASSELSLAVVLELGMPLSGVIHGMYQRIGSRAVMLNAAQSILSIVRHFDLRSIPRAATAFEWWQETDR